MGRAASVELAYFALLHAYGGEERWIQGFSGENWGKETTWKTQA
jgi:hypothetical protein